MRVRISYSVELEEVPSESQRLLQNAINNLHEAWTNLQKLERELDEKMSDVATKQGVLSICDEARKGLAAADNIILDASMIISGYYQAHEPQPEQDLEGPAEEIIEDPVEEVSDVPER